MDYYLKRILSRGHTWHEDLGTYVGDLQVIWYYSEEMCQGGAGWGWQGEQSADSRSLVFFFFSPVGDKMALEVFHRRKALSNLSLFFVLQ